MGRKEYLFKIDMPFKKVIKKINEPAIVEEYKKTAKERNKNGKTTKKF